MKVMRVFFGEKHYDIPLKYNERETVTKAYAEGKRCIIFDQEGSMINTTNADAIQTLNNHEEA
ncbi:hypothetical protein OCA16_25775 [Bacillus cereus]|nr:hypothetical protein [Bacillus cereus]